MNLLTVFRVYGGPSMTPPPNSEEGGTGRYGDFETDFLAELDLLIEELTIAAEEAIERAAAEAAKAAAVTALERETAALQEAAYWRKEAEAVKSRRTKSALLGGAVCFLSGLVVGAGGIIIFGGR